MKQNIIIVLLTAICGLLGWVGAQVYEERQEKAKTETAQSVQAVQEQIAQTSEQLNRAVVEADLAVQDIKETAGLPTDEIVNGGVYDNKSTEVRDPSDPQPKNQGVIQIVAIVDKDGKVIEANLLNRSQFKELNDAALNNTLNKKIPPKIINGQPFKTRYLIPVKYEIY
ncbi:TonB-like protein [Inovirus D_HF35_23]|nr:TonB-like protein [Inovirus D_HF35_23]